MKLKLAYALFLTSLPAAVFTSLSVPYLPFVGFASWIYIFYYSKDVFGRLNSTSRVLLAFLLLSCGISMLGNHTALALLGSGYSAIGSLVLISCISIGLVASTLPIKFVIKCLYAAALTLALTAPIYDHWKYGGFGGRLQGIVSQSDVLAIWMGVGFFIGLYLLSQKLDLKRKILLAAGQMALLAAIYLTQTRVALALTLLLAACYLLANRKNWRPIAVGVMPALLVGIVLIISVKVPRLSNGHYASSSVTYRLELQTVALKDLSRSPAWGTGAGNEPNILDCSKMQTYPPLAKTCHDGYVFTSSHNIFLDRFLQLGWLGGLSYLVIFGYGAALGLTSKVRSKQLFGFGLVLIGLYYLTNVTSAELELLIWVLLGCVLTVNDVTANRQVLK